MTPKERIDAVLLGEEPDRIPVSFWRHFYEYESDPIQLAEAMLLFQENYQWDFMKINPRSTYYHEDWGSKYRFYKDGRKPERISVAVEKVSDYNKITPLEPLKAKALREHIDAVHYIKKGLPKNFYFVMTIFSPLSIVADMSPSKEIFYQFMKEDAKAVKGALESVTVTFEKFCEELLNVGVSGIFFATTHWGTYNRLTEEEFDEFSRPYDMRVLKKVEECPFNILHVCKSRNMLGHLKDYPVSAFNWDAADPTNLPLDEGRDLLKKPVIGGIDQKKISLLDAPSLTSYAHSLYRRMGKRMWILGGGCTIPPNTPSNNLKALREWVESLIMV